MPRCSECDEVMDSGERGALCYSCQEKEDEEDRMSQMLKDAEDTMDEDAEVECPSCGSTYTHEGEGMTVCQECLYRWNEDTVERC